MARRKIFHSKRKFTYQKSGSGFRNYRDIKLYNIIEFKYSGKNIYDNTPLVFVTSIPTPDFDKKIIKGINLNYLTEYRIQQLIQEIDHKRMQWYELYKDSIRSYSVDKISRIRKLNYKRDLDAT